MDIYEQIDELYNQIQREKNNVKKLTDEKDKKIQELKDICMLYAENIYKFLGDIDRDHLSTFELLALDGLKAAADLCIKDDDFKQYLKLKYIDKNYDAYMKALEEQITKNSGTLSVNFVKDTLSENHIEDDTDTLVILEDN